MQECQYQAQDMMKPGYEKDAKLTAKVEEKLIGCMANTVDKVSRQILCIVYCVLYQLET